MNITTTAGENMCSMAVPSTTTAALQCVGQWRERRRRGTLLCCSPATASTSASASASASTSTATTSATAPPVDPKHPYKHSHGKLGTSPEFLSGAGAALVNVVVTFPANKLMFRQQVAGLHIHKAFKSMIIEGVGQLYRGMLPPLLQKTTSLSLMFGMNALYRDILEEHTSLGPGAVVAAAAGMSGATEALLTPFERIQSLLQMPEYNARFTHTWDAAQALRKYGLKEYYRGASPIVFRNAGSNILFFALREPLHNALPAADSCAWCGWLRSFAAGAILGATISTLFFPVNVAKSVMQKRVGTPLASAVPTLIRVVSKRGISGTYRGVNVNFMRALVSWGLINTCYEVFMQQFDRLVN